jgi:hypothetical protein
LDGWRISEQREEYEMRRHALKRTPWLGRGLVAAVMLAAMVPVFAHGARAQDAPSLEIVSPAAGTQVTTDDIDVTVKVSNFTIDCSQAGRPDKEGEGHIHLMIDGMTMATLANFYCAETFTVSGDGLAPGKHTLIVDLATNTHLDMMETAQEVEIDYQPANVRPLPAANDQGEPGVELVTPSDGAEVDAKFTVEVKPVNFIPSETLEGKQNVPGYGHYHVFVDTDMSMGMMGMEGSPEAEHEMAMGSPEAGMDDMHVMAMGGMVLMPGTNTFDLDLTAWGPGEHTIWIEPVQNDHTTFETFGHAEFTVTVK